MATDPEFRTVLNQYLQNIKTAHSERLRKLCGLALKTIEDYLDDQALSPKERLLALVVLLLSSGLSWKITPYRRF